MIPPRPLFAAAARLTEPGYFSEILTLVICHCLHNDFFHLICRLDEAPVGKVSVTGCGPAPPAPEQAADQGQVLVGHDGMAGVGVTAEPTRIRPRRDRVPPLERGSGQPVGDTPVCPVRTH